MHINKQHLFENNFLIRFSICLLLQHIHVLVFLHTSFDCIVNYSII